MPTPEYVATHIPIPPNVYLAKRLKELALAGAFEYSDIVRNDDGVVTSATVTWPDGVVGQFLATSINATFKTVDAYTITYQNRTVTQPALTRDASGNVTIQPPITVTP